MRTMTFSELSIGQQFTFTEDSDLWIGLCEKIDSSHYVMLSHRRILVKVGNTIKYCNVVNNQTVQPAQQTTKGHTNMKVQFCDVHIGQAFYFLGEPELCTKVGYNSYSYRGLVWIVDNITELCIVQTVQHAQRIAHCTTCTTGQDLDRWQTCRGLVYVLSTPFAQSF